MKKIFLPLLGGLLATSMFFNAHLMDKKELLEADLEQTYFELNGAQDALDSLYCVLDSLECSEEFAGKASDVIRCAMDNHDELVVQIMRAMTPEIEEELMNYSYCY